MAAGLEDAEVVGREPLPEGKGAAGFQRRRGLALPSTGINVDDDVRAGHEALDGLGSLVGNAVAFAHAQGRRHAEIHVEEGAGARGAHAQAAEFRHAGNSPDGLLDGGLGLGGAGVHEDAGCASGHLEAGLEDEERNKERRHGVGLADDLADVRRRVQPIAEPDGQHAQKDHA